MAIPLLLLVLVKHLIRLLNYKGRSMTMTMKMRGFEAAHLGEMILISLSHSVLTSKTHTTG